MVWSVRAEPGRIGVPVLPYISGFVLIYLAKNLSFQIFYKISPPLKKIIPTSLGMISYSNNYLIPHFHFSLWQFHWQSSKKNNCLVDDISKWNFQTELETEGHKLDIHISNIVYNYIFYLLVLEFFGRIHISNLMTPQGPRRHFEVGGANTCTKFWNFPLLYSFCHWISSVDSDRLDDSDKKDNSNSAVITQPYQ